MQTKLTHFSAFICALWTLLSFALLSFHQRAGRMYLHRKSLCLNVFPSVNNWIENWKTVSFSSAPASVWSNKNTSCLNSTMAVYRQLSASSFMQLMLMQLSAADTLIILLFCNYGSNEWNAQTGTNTLLFSFSSFHPAQHANINSMKGHRGHPGSLNVRNIEGEYARWKRVNQTEPLQEFGHFCLFDFILFYLLMRVSSFFCLVLNRRHSTGNVPRFSNILTMSGKNRFELESHF